MHIYLIEPSGELKGPVDLPSVPGIGLQTPSNAIVLDEPLPASSPGRVWAIIDAQPPLQVEDARGLYYHTDSGSQFTQSELGPLPDGLTSKPRPDPYHVWDGARWVVDSVALATHLAVTERTWRDSEIIRYEWLISRHRAEIDLQRDTTLSNERFRVLLAYLQSLRDWPQSSDFPDPTQRPIAPPWIAEHNQ